MTTMIQYPLHVFEEVKKNGFEFEFDDNIIHMIQDIAEKVGAPGYIKTPIFAKKKKEKPTLKATVIKPEITNLFDEIKLEIRKLMNKISNDSYEGIFNELCKKIDSLINEENKSTDKIQDEMSYIGNLIFDLATFNHFYSSLYAKLYRDLMKKYDILSNVLECTFTKFIERFHNIKYVSPNEDYNAYCEYNDNKEIRKALTSFVGELCILDVIEECYVVTLINDLYSQFYQHIKYANMKYLCDEISEYIKLLVCTTINVLMKYPDDWDCIHNKIIESCKLKPRVEAGFSSKALFCFYDIRDKIKKMDN